MNQNIGIAVLAAALAWSSAAAADSATFCADEHGFCKAPAGYWINYGMAGHFKHRRSPPGGLRCDNAEFGDPLPGVPKKCFYSPPD